MQFALKVRGLESASYIPITIFLMTTSGMREWHHRKYSNSNYSETIADIYAQFALKVRRQGPASYMQAKYLVTTSGMRE